MRRHLIAILIATTAYSADFREVTIIQINKQESGWFDPVTHTIVEARDRKRYRVRGMWGKPGDTFSMDFDRTDLFLENP